MHPAVEKLPLTRGGHDVQVLLPEVPLVPKASFFERLLSFGASCQQCCTPRPHAKLKLLTLEDRVVPATGFRLVESVVIDSTSLTGGAFTLENTANYTTYKVVVSGDVLVDTKGTRADAEFASFSSATTTFSGENIGIRFEDATISTINGAGDIWGPYSPSHVYSRSMTTIGTHPTIIFHDPVYTDNTGSFTVDVYEIVAPQDLVATEPGCDCAGSLSTDPGFIVSPSPATTQGGLRYANGSVRVTDMDLTSNGFGFPWGRGRTWTNDPGFFTDSDATNGAGEVACETPSIQLVGTSVALVSNGGAVRYFDAQGTAYKERHGMPERLVKATSPDRYVLTDSTGGVFTFYDFNDAVVGQRGQLKDYANRYGHELSVTRNGSGVITSMSRTDGTTTESFDYAYYNGTASDDLLQTVTWKKNGTAIRSVAYEYHDGTTTMGSAGTLRLVKVKDASGSVIETTYYRWYMTGESDGYNNALKYVVRKASYDRMMQWATSTGSNPDTVSDAQIATYADFYFEYDSSHRVSLQKILGAGCSSCFGGIGNYSYTYEAAEHGAPVGYNHWAMKTTETLADGTQNIVYSNSVGEVMLFAVQDGATGRLWMTHYVYDGLGRVIQRSNPSSTTALNDDFATLMVSDGARVSVSPEVQVNEYTTSSQTKNP